MRSKVLNAGNSKRWCTSASIMTLIISAKSSFVCAASIPARSAVPAILGGGKAGADEVENGYQQGRKAGRQRGSGKERQNGTGGSGPATRDFQAGAHVWATTSQAPGNRG